MNIVIFLVAGCILFYLGYRIYGHYIAGIFGEDDKNPTPAVAMKDNLDYVPTKMIVLFGHHFSSIAGGGPIIGPTVALLFGYLPVWLWIVLGCILIGGVHDLSVLFASIREKGKSISEIAKKTLGKTGFFLFISFTIIMLLTVTAAFLSLTATALTSLVPLHLLKLPTTQTLLKTCYVDGMLKAKIGGIASTSVIIITCLAPLMGYLVYKKRVNIYLVCILAIVICFVSIVIGMRYPITLTPLVWMIILSVYTLFAAGIPVWVILQPRDFTNSFLLYIGVFILFLGGLIVGFKGGVISAPILNLKEGADKLGNLWPFLFIMVACGAISGFHSLVAGGTTSKQIALESHAKKIAYGGMMLEGMLALCVLTAVGCGIMYQDYLNIVFPSDPGVKSNPILAFALSAGGLLDKSLGIPPAYGTVFGILLVEGFVLTSLDTAVRLMRYLLEELWQLIFKKVPKLFKAYIFNALICVILMFCLSYFNVFLIIWPIFGSANQLLASLVLIAISVWLVNKKKKVSWIILPAIFMMITTLYSLINLLITKYIPKGNITLTIVDLLLIILAIGVIILAIKKLFKVSSTNLNT